MNRRDIEGLANLLPEARQEIRRLEQLMSQGREARIAVFGKYNHGKSTLLNALVGKEVFKASDRRETRENQEFAHRGVVWIDTPGLDADVNGADDRRARQGAFELADYLLLVHNIKTGELDRYELDLYRRMVEQHQSKRVFLVLSQIDQLQPDEGDRVYQRIKRQLPDITVIQVSALRYQRGIHERRERFVELSGMPDLLALTGQLKSGLQASRQREQTDLQSKIGRRLQQRIGELQTGLAQRREEREQRRQKFASAVDQALNKTAAYG